MIAYNGEMIVCVAAPVYQMTGYYRDGTFDDCRSKWSEFGAKSKKPSCRDL